MTRLNLVVRHYGNNKRKINKQTSRQGTRTPIIQVKINKRPAGRDNQTAKQRVMLLKELR